MHLLGEIPIRCGHDSDIDGDGLRSADRFDLAFLEHTQELGLKDRCRVGDFVQKDRASVCLLEQSPFIGHSSCKCAFHMAEQFAFKQRFRQGAAIDDDERLLVPLAQGMNRLGQQPFPCSTLALNQDRGRTVRHQAYHVEELLHGRTPADQLAHRLSHRGRRVPGFDRLDPGQRRALLIVEENQHGRDLAPA